MAAVDLRLLQAVDQAPPTVVATLTGESRRAARRRPFERVLDLRCTHGRFLIVGEGGAAPQPAHAARSRRTRACRRASGAFRKLRLVNVAPKLGLDFRQGAFRYSMAYDQQAMMGGGVCWLDYDNDGWLDLFAVNSYADVDMPEWASHGGLPPSALFQNVHGRFVNVSTASHAGIRVKGTGCVAADLNGDGHTDLIVTTATGVDVLWNNGNGTFTEGAHAATRRTVRLVRRRSRRGRERGRPARTSSSPATRTWRARIPSSIAGFPTNYEGVRDLLFLNEGDGPNGRAIQGGRRRGGPRVVAFPARARRDLHRRERRRAPRPLRRKRRGPERPLRQRARRAARLPLRRRRRRRTASTTTNAGMGVAEGDFNGDGRPDLFVTNSRGQAHAAYQSKILKTGETAYTPEMPSSPRRSTARRRSAGATRAIDFGNNGNPDLIIANGAIPVTNLKKDTEPLQVLQGLGGGRFTNASGIIDPKGMPKIIGRGLAAADFDNDGRMAVAINTIGGPLVLLAGHRPGRPLARGLAEGLPGRGGAHRHAPERPHARAGAPRRQQLPLLGATRARTSGSATRPGSSKLTIRWPDGRVSHLANIAADRIVTVAQPSK